MRCPNCGRDSVGGGRFCSWCQASLIDANVHLSGLGRRWLASVLDVFVGWFIVIVAVALMIAGKGGGAALGLLLLVGVVVWWFYLWRSGATPGKLALGIRVRKTDGNQPGILTMLFREWIAKYIDGFVFGLGWFWAIWDRDKQAWHDKLANTVVVRVAREATVAAASS